MVNVDELNGYIDKFGEVTDKLDTLGKSAESIERATKAQEELVDMARQIMDEQKNATGLLKTQWTEVQMSINTHVDNTEKHLSDKIELTDKKVEQMEGHLKASITDQLKDVQKEIENYKMDIDEKIKSIKTTQYITLSCALIAAVLVVVMHFV